MTEREEIGRSYLTMSGGDAVFVDDSVSAVQQEPVCTCGLDDITFDETGAASMPRLAIWCPKHDGPLPNTLPRVR